MKKILNLKFIKSIGWQVAAQIYTMLLALVIGSLTARYLGPSNYGLIGYGQSLVSLFNTIATLGMGEVIIKDLIDNPDKNAVIIGTAFSMRFISSFISIGLIQVIVLVLEPGNSVLQIITMLQAIGLLLQSCDVLTYWFQAKMEFMYPAIGTIIASTLVSAWRVTLLIHGIGVEWFALSSCIQYFVTGMVTFTVFICKKNHHIRISTKYMKNIFSRSYHFILSNLAITLYTQMDKVMIGKLCGETEVGIYTAASTIAGLWQFIPISVINSAKPLIYKSFRENKNSYQEKQSVLYVGLTLLSIFVGLGILLFGRIAVLILYGQDYLEAVIALNILIWATGFAIIGTARGSTWVIVNNLNKYVKYVVSISSAVNIALNYFLIPAYGINGAAVATLISQITTVFIAPILFKEMREFIRLYFYSWPVAYRVLIDKINKN